MEIGLGGLGWPPSIFWAATPHEFFAALDGLNEKNGGKTKGRSSLSKSDVKKLRRMLDEAR